jgi:cytosine/adenosine deaminase-related metal-dependent hydrolase
MGGQLLGVSGERVLKNSSLRFSQAMAVHSQVTPAEVEAMTAYALARGLRQGVTFNVEHLWAPAQVENAMRAQARSAERLGARLMVSHASSDGIEGVSPAEQIEGNAAFVQAFAAHPHIRGSLGFFASFCASDDLLKLLAQARERLTAGVHFHLSDTDDDAAQLGRRAVARLVDYRVLGPGSVAAYARGIDRVEAELLAKSETVIALSPRMAQTMPGAQSGMEAVLAAQALVGLGTSGNATLWHELRGALAIVVAMARAGQLLDPDGLMAQFLYGGAAELCTHVFGTPCGNVEVGALADVVVYDHVSWDEGVADAGVPWWSMLDAAPVAWTIVNGRVTVREGQLLGADYISLAKEASAAASAVARRSGLPLTGR